MSYYYCKVLFGINRVKCITVCLTHSDNELGDLPSPSGQPKSKWLLSAFGLCALDSGYKPCPHTHYSHSIFSFLLRLLGSPRQRLSSSGEFVFPNADRFPFPPQALLSNSPFSFSELCPFPLATFLISATSWAAQHLLSKDLLGGESDEFYFPPSSKYLGHFRPVV